MERVDHFVRLTGATQHVIRLESACGDGMQMREHLQGRTQPGIDLTWHRGRHRKR